MRHICSARRRKRQTSIVKMIIMMIMDMISMMIIVITHILLTTKELYILTFYLLPVSSSDLIIEYSSNPPNKGMLEHADIRYREANRVCADVVEVSLIIQENMLTEFMFDGYMSIVATACVSITGELLE
jgi:hypothetical protein